ncbi:MAG: hypothetical protein JWO60_388 [Frankiales bacterium]|nr:hypothetical protein [Frankiales bacterium]
MSRRRTTVAALSLAVLAGALATPAGAADTTLSGTLLGSDGRAVSALLGFDLKDDEGRTLGASGCVKSPSCPVDGYAVTKRVNFDLGAAGGDRDDWATTWRVALPAEEERVYVEVHPQGRGYRGTDKSRYAASFRRNLRLPYDTSVNLRLPLVCDPVGGGTDGAGLVYGTAVEADGRTRVPLKRVTAFSLETDNNRPTPVLGTSVGAGDRYGAYRVEDLASGVAPGQPGGQRYQLIATAADGRVERVYRGVDVRPCGRERADIVFSRD